MKSFASTLIVALLVSSSAAEAAKPKNVPTALPAFKGKKKVKVDLTTSSESSVVLVVSEPVAKTNSEARDLRKKQTVVAKPAPVMTNEIEGPKDIVVGETETVSGTTEAKIESTAATTATASAIGDQPTATVTVPAEAKAEVAAAPIVPHSSSAEFKTAPVTNVASTETLAVGVLPTGFSASIAAPLSRPRQDRTVFFEAGYVDARYNKLQDDLQNGATTMSLSLGVEHEKLEFRAALDVAHGLDQSVQPQNVRMLIGRAGAFAKLSKVGRMQISGGATIGAAGVNVRSYRGVTGDEYLIKQHLLGTAAVIVPEITSRVELGQQVLLQVAAKYLVLAGPSELSKLSGASVGAAVGYAF